VISRKMIRLSRVYEGRREDAGARVLDDRLERWEEFERRYRKELEDPDREKLLEEVAALACKGPVTLHYAAKNEEHNQAVVLREVFEERLAA